MEYFTSFVSIKKKKKRPGRAERGREETVLPDLKKVEVVIWGNQELQLNGEVIQFTE